MIDATSIATHYLAIWNESNPGARRRLIATTFAADADYADPMMQGAGHDGIDAMIAAAQQKFAGHRFSLRGTPDGHNGLVRFSWTLTADGAAPIAHGTDIAVIDADGRIARVAGFLDTVAPAAAPVAAATI